MGNEQHHQDEAGEQVDTVTVVAVKEFLNIIDMSVESDRQIVNSITQNCRELTIDSHVWKVLDYHNDELLSDFLTELCGYKVPVGMTECTLEEFAVINEQYRKIATSQKWLLCVGCGADIEHEEKNISTLDNKSFLCNDCFTQEWDLNKKIDPSSQLIKTIQSLPGEELEKMIEATAEISYEVALQAVDSDFMRVVNDFTRSRIEVINQHADGIDNDSYNRALYMEAFVLAYVMGYGMGTVDAERFKEEK